MIKPNVQINDVAFISYLNHLHIYCSSLFSSTFLSKIENKLWLIKCLKTLSINKNLSRKMTSMWNSLIQSVSKSILTQLQYRLFLFNLTFSYYFSGFFSFCLFTSVYLSFCQNLLVVQVQNLESDWTISRPCQINLYKKLLLNTDKKMKKKLILFFLFLLKTVKS